MDRLMAEPTVSERFEEQTARVAAQSGPCSENARALAAAFVAEDSYFCPVCHGVVQATAIVYGQSDGITCRSQGREHTVYLNCAPIER